MTFNAVDELFDRYGPSYRWFVTMTVMLGTMSTVLTATMINVAIPSVMGAFGIGQDKAHWLSTGFLAAQTIAMLVNDWSVKSFGMRRTFVVAVAIFLAGSIMGGFAPDEDILIAARIMQGLGAGLMQPLSMVIIYRVFPENKRGMAMGMFGLGIVVAPAFGPTVGGLLVDTFNWRYVMFAAVPFTALAGFMATLFLPWREQTGPRPNFDWTGLILILTCISCLITGISNGQRIGWYSLEISGLLLTGICTGVFFVIWEILHPRPILQIRLFLNWRFASSCLIATGRGAGFFGTTYLIPLFVQLVQGYTPTRSGLLMVPAGIVMMIMFPLAGRLSDYLPVNLLLMFGLFLFGVSIFLMSGADTHTAFWVFAIWLMIGRFGMSFITPILNVTSLRSVPENMLNQASSAVNFVRQLGGAIGVNMVAVTLEWQTAFFSEALTSTQTIANDASRELIRRIEGILAQLGYSESQQTAGAMQYLGDTLYTQASMLAFRDAFMMMAGIFFLLMIPAFFMGRDGKRKK